MKKREAWLNTFNPIFSYLWRCNTDVTCLLSGTMVRAVIAYTTDYITKMALKTHAVFEVVRSVLQGESDISPTLNTNEGRRKSARHLIQQMVNALTAKQETGGPMVARGRW